MAINLCRAPRDTGKNGIGEGVAPGTYDVKTDAIKADTEKPVPFASGVDKICCPNLGTSAYTPGPGTYVGQINSHEEASGLGHICFKSKAARIGPSAPGSTAYCESTVKKNPGPGTYGSKGDWDLSMKKPPRNAANPWTEAITKTVPSIPLQKLPPGATAENSMGADISNVTMRHTGETKDTVGPGEYDPSHYLTTAGRQATSISAGAPRSKPDISDVALPSQWNPGPGAYEAKAGIADFPDEEEKKSTFQFASKTQLSYQKALSNGKGAPGPGQYESRGQIDKSATKAKSYSTTRGEQTRFGSAVQRVGWSRAVENPFVDPYNVHHVPGPGSYSNPNGIFPSTEKKKEEEASKAIPGNKKKTYHGVHHPMIVMALQETQGPLEAFGSTDDRACNKIELQKTPAPWSYSREEARGHSMASDLREKKKIGRAGAFGTLADRFYGSPMQGRDDVPDPSGTGEGGIGEGSGSYTEPRAVFNSQTPRMREPSSGEPQAVKLGSFQTPAPGDYVTEKDVNYRSPFRHPRVDHLSFGSGQTRFDLGREVFTGHGPEANPAPGDYDTLVVSARGRGHAHAKEKRRLSAKVGSTTEEVGPGSYGTIDTPMLKKTFNVSTQLPASASAYTPRRPRKEESSMGM